MDVFASNTLRFHYAVLQSTNFMGWNLPLEFEFQQNELRGDKNWAPGCWGSGRITSIRPGSKPSGVFTPGMTQTIIDYRYQADANGGEAAIYTTTNSFLAPLKDPVLSKQP